MSNDGMAGSAIGTVKLAHRQTVDRTLLPRKRGLTLHGA
jgi:hypothetical protein